MTDIVSPLPTLARYAIMIDVGYIYAAAGELLFSVGSRREYRVDTDKLIQAPTAWSGASCCASTVTTRPGTGCPPSTSG